NGSGPAAPRSLTPSTRPPPGRCAPSWPLPGSGRAAAPTPTGTSWPSARCRTTTPSSASPSTQPSTPPTAPISTPIPSAGRQLQKGTLDDQHKDSHKDSTDEHEEHDRS